LGEQANYLGDRATNAGRGAEVAAGGIEFGEIESSAANNTRGGDVRNAKQLLFPLGVVGAEGWMNIGARHGALTAVREPELAAFGQRVGIYFSFDIIVVAIGGRLWGITCRWEMVGGRPERFGPACCRYSGGVGVVVCRFPALIFIL